MGIGPETTLKGRLIPKLRRIPKVDYIVVQQQSRCGDPDMTITVNGHPIYMELKRKKKMPTALQIYKLKKHEYAGGYSMVVFPANEDEAISFIQKLSNTRTKLEVPECLLLHNKK
jgi:hypothetical protein